jgi:kynurenine formamidase
LSRSRLVDLSHAVGHGTVTYPGLPGPEITDHLTREASRAGYAPGTEFQIGRISMVANTGTYVDSPFHRFAGAADLSQLPLERLADVPGLVVRASGERAVGRSRLEGHDVRGRAVLLHTGWDRHWATDRYGGEDAPFLAADGAAWLVEQGAFLVGIDSINIDDRRDGARPAHTALLGAGVTIVEHMTGLGGLPEAGFRVHAAPPRIAGLGSFPVRAYAVIGVTN